MHNIEHHASRPVIQFKIVANHIAVLRLELLHIDSAITVGVNRSELVEHHH